MAHKILTLRHEGYHGTTTVCVRPLDEAGQCISQRTARRIHRAVCGIPDCTCGWDRAFAEPVGGRDNRWRIMRDAKED